MLVGGREIKHWPYPCARPGTAVHTHMEVGGPPVSAEDKGGVWGAGIRTMCLGTGGDNTCQEEGRDFSSTGIARRSVFLLHLLT